MKNPFAATAGNISEAPPSDEPRIKAPLGCAAGPVTPIVFDGFGEGIRALNHVLVSPHQRSFSNGRAYAKPDASTDKPPAAHVSLIYGLCFGEMPTEELLGDLTKQDHTGTLYMGAAGFQNLSYVGTMRAGGAILFDINPIQTWFWNYILPMLANETSGEAFMDCLVSRLPEMQHHVARMFCESGNDHPFLTRALDKSTARMILTLHTFISTPLEQWRLHRNAGLHWVWDRDAYAHLHDMARRDAIGALTLDILDQEGWMQLAQHLDTNPCGAPSGIKTIYLSNILTFLTGEDTFTCRRDQNANPVYARAVVSQILDKSGTNIITNEACPHMTWPRSTETPKAPEVHPSSGVWARLTRQRDKLRL